MMFSEARGFLLTFLDKLFCQFIHDTQNIVNVLISVTRGLCVSVQGGVRWRGRGKEEVEGTREREGGGEEGERRWRGRAREEVEGVEGKRGKKEGKRKEEGGRRWRVMMWEQEGKSPADIQLVHVLTIKSSSLP